MIWQRVRIALSACVALAAAAVAARAGGPAPCDSAPVAPAPACRTVSVQEWVPQQYEAVRTVYKTECVQEKYQAWRTECVPETRTNVVTVNRMVPEWREETRTVCTSVPSVETRTGYKRVQVCKQVTTVSRKCVDMGHYECREVPCKESCFKRRKHHGDCCEPCPPPTKTVKVWCPNKVWVETPCTRTVRTWECVPYTYQVTVCKMVPQQQTVKVCVNRCVPEQKTVTCTVMVARKVPYEATRTVARCVPVQEKYTACRMVCRTVEKQVPVETCGESCESSSCYTPCCESGHGHRRGHKGKCCN
jgi:hypothetical protein